jgi:uncharacterized protein YoxC
MDKLIDFIGENAAVFRGAPGAFLILVILGLGGGFTFARYVIDAGVISGKEATIENLKTQVEGLKNENDELTKKLTSASGKDATIESLNNRIATLEAEKADLNKKLAFALKARTDEELNETSSAQLPVKSPILGLDDAKRYQLIKELRDATANGANGRETCHAMVHEQPGEKWAPQIWPDLQDILNYSSWWVEGGRMTKSYFPPGITLSSTKDAGDGFNCAFRLSEMFLGLKLPTTLRDNQVSPDLNACEKENPTHGCVEIIMGGGPASP